MKSAENNFTDNKKFVNPKGDIKKNVKTIQPKFPKTLTEAYREHKKIFMKWKNAGRPQEKNNPINQQLLE